MTRGEERLRHRRARVVLGRVVLVAFTTVGTIVAAGRGAAAQVPAKPQPRATPARAAQGKSAPGAAARPAAGPTTPARALALVRALSDDSLQGRRAGTPGAAKAAAFLAHAMAQAGLLPAGDSVAGVDPSRAHPTRESDFSQVVTLANPRGDSVHAIQVVGYIPGADTNINIRTAHIFVVAHYDHLGFGPAVNGDSLYNGANDDASGTVAVLEIARQLAQGPRPRRTIVFVAFGAGEGGTATAQWEQLPSHLLLSMPFGSPQATLQIERIGRPDARIGGVGHAWLTDAKWSTLGKQLTQAKLVVADPSGSVTDPRTPHPVLGDCVIRFTHRGLGHTLSSAGPTADTHQPSDEASRLDGRHLAAVINAAAKAVRLAANTGVSGLVLTRGDNPLSSWPLTDPGYPNP